MGGLNKETESLSMQAKSTKRTLDKLAGVPSYRKAKGGDFDLRSPTTTSIRPSMFLPKTGKIRGTAPEKPLLTPDPVTLKKRLSEPHCSISHRSNLTRDASMASPAHPQNAHSAPQPANPPKS